MERWFDIPCLGPPTPAPPGYGGGAGTLASIFEELLKPASSKQFSSVHLISIMEYKAYITVYTRNKFFRVCSTPPPLPLPYIWKPFSVADINIFFFKIHIGANRKITLAKARWPFVAGSNPGRVALFSSQTSITSPPMSVNGYLRGSTWIGFSSQAGMLPRKIRSFEVKRLSEYEVRGPARTLPR